MSKVAIITQAQANQLTNVEYINGCYFNPVQDANNNWVISEEEVNQCNVDWVKALTLTTFNPKPNVNAIP